MKKLLFILIAQSSISLAVEPMDNYYADDLIDAVNQAKERPHHYDYSSTYRYKRTTAQSIEMNRLDLDEMDDTRLEMQGKAVSLLPGEQSIENPNQLPNEQNSPKQTNTASIPIQNVIPVSSHYHSIYGQHSSEGIVNQGTLVSTPRP